MYNFQFSHSCDVDIIAVPLGFTAKCMSSVSVDAANTRSFEGFVAECVLSILVVHEDSLRVLVVYHIYQSGACDNKYVNRQCNLPFK